MAGPREIAIDTPAGPARAHLHAPEGEPRMLVVLGHGAGGGVAAPDLVAATDVATGLGALVALTEQPYRVAGRRSPAPAPRLDLAWTAMVATLREEAPSVPLVTGGRSSGARVACRTAAETGASGVLCLAFPLQPSAGKGRPPRPSRLPELEAVEVPVLIVQGEGDPFGMPPEAPGREVARLRGDHSLRSDMPGLRAAVGAWLAARLA
ncbi:MAG: alpha/beta family hydrolase [Thermoleophilia bacterium]